MSIWDLAKCSPSAIELMIKNLHWTDICHVAEEYHLYKKNYYWILHHFGIFKKKNFYSGIFFLILLALMLIINSILSVFHINKKLLY